MPSFGRFRCVMAIGAVLAVSGGGTGRVWKPRPYFYDDDDLGGLTVRGEFVGGGRARNQDGAFHGV